MQIQEFINYLETLSPQMLTTDSIIKQCTYLGISFGRIGADFTNEISRIFITILYHRFQIKISKASKDLKKNLNNFLANEKFQKLGNPVKINSNYVSYHYFLFIYSFNIMFILSFEFLFLLNDRLLRFRIYYINILMPNTAMTYF